MQSVERSVFLSLFLVISSGAAARTPHEDAASQPIELFNSPLRGAQTRTGNNDMIRTHGGAGCRMHHARRVHRQFPTRDTVAQEDGTQTDTRSGPVRPIGAMQIGKAAWYNLVGAHTSSGEVLDTVTATAAHRSLPLASYAKVTNLHSGRSIVVKINDRGPWTGGFIIDLSPRAADAIGVRRTGVAPVIVEPVTVSAASAAAAPTLATYQADPAR